MHEIQCSIDISTVKIETIERHRTYTHTHTHIRQYNETEQQRENERNKKNYHESGIFNAIAIQALTRNRSYMVSGDVDVLVMCLCPSVTELLFYRNKKKEEI